MPKNLNVKDSPQDEIKRKYQIGESTSLFGECDYYFPEMKVNKL